MKIALLTDTHFGERNSSNVFDSYIWKFYDQVFFPECKARGITETIHLGDLVHKRERIDYMIMSSVLNLMGRDMQWRIIIGNHDCPYKNTNSPNAVDLLCGSMPHVQIYSHPTTIPIGFDKYTIIPWINDENRSEALGLIEMAPTQVLFGHLEILGFEWYAGQPSHSGIGSSIFSKYKKVFTGHFHHKSSRDNIHYLGAPYEMVWSDYNDPRGFHIYDTATGELEFIRNPFTLFKKFFYDDSSKVEIAKMKKAVKEDFSDQYVKLVVVKKTKPKLFETVFDEIAKQQPHDIDIMEDFGDLVFDDQETEVPTDTLAFVNEAIEKFELADASHDAPKLKTLMREIYMEALTQENVEL